MSKLILLDIDGTLRDEQFGIPKSIEKVLDLCEKMHHKVSLCTGRGVGMIQEDVRDLRIETLIAGGGSYISHKNFVIKDESFSSDSMKSLWNSVLISEIACSLEGNEKVFMNQAAVNILNEMNQKKYQSLTNEQRQYLKQKEKICYCNNFSGFNANSNRIHKICLWCEPDDFFNIKGMLKEEEIVLAQQGKWKKKFYYEIIKQGSNKGDAVEELCQYLKIDRNDTIAFGDGKNDIDMLKQSGIGIAMKNSAIELLPFADSICETPMEDGIYKELKRRELI